MRPENVARAALKNLYRGYSSFASVPVPLMFFFCIVKCPRTLDNSICYNYENLTFLCVTFNFLFLRVFWLHDARGLKERGQLEWILFRRVPLLRIVEKFKANRKYIIRILLKIFCLPIYCWKYVVYMYLYKSRKLVKIENNCNFQTLRYRSWILRRKFTDLKLKVIINLEVSSFLSLVHFMHHYKFGICHFRFLYLPPFWTWRKSLLVLSLQKSLYSL